MADSLREFFASVDAEPSTEFGDGLLAQLQSEFEATAQPSRPGSTQPRAGSGPSR